MVDAALPDDMSITISKTGKQPATVTVKQGTESWETTEKELDKLPEKARPYAERMLGKTSGVSVRVVGEAGSPPRAATSTVAPHAPANVHKQLEEMGQRIDELGKLIEGLKQSGPQAEAAPQEQQENAPQERTAPEKTTEPQHQTKEHSKQTTPPKEL